jgi:hypothetical protein
MKKDVFHAFFFAFTHLPIHPSTHLPKSYRLDTSRYGPAG